MTSDDLPGVVQQYNEEIDTRFNFKFDKNKFVVMPESVGKGVRANKCFETVMETNRDQYFVNGSLEPIAESVVIDTMKENYNINEKIGSKPTSDHSETFMKIQKLNILYGLILGLSVHKAWKYNNATRWTKFMLIFGTTITIYSHLVVVSEPAKLIEVFCICGIVIPAFLKFNLFVKKWPLILSGITFLEKVFNLNSDGAKASILKQHIDGTFTSIKIFISIQTLGLIIFVYYPIYAFIVNNEFVALMPMEFPFVDQNTTFGFILANLLMLKMGIWAYFGSVCFDVFLARSIFNFTALVKLLQQDLLEYADVCKRRSDYSKQFEREYLRNIFLKCQDKDRYIKFINDLFADIIFKQFGILYVCLIFTLYAIIRSNWYSGFGFVLFCLTEVYILCILGTTIKTENDNFCTAIYNMPWYEYPISTQKAIKVLLHSSQNAKELWVGPVARLNVETGMEITKSIYSTSTMIMNTGD